MQTNSLEGRIRQLAIDAQHILFSFPAPFLYAYLIEDLSYDFPLWDQHVIATSNKSDHRLSFRPTLMSPGVMYREEVTMKSDVWYLIQLI